MFIQNINLGQYVPTGSLIHKLDPRAKLFSLIFIISAVFPAKNFLQLSFWILFLVVLVRASKISFSDLIGASKPVFFLGI